MKSTQKASKAFVDKKKQEREDRKEKILKILKEQPGQTVYSLSKLEDLGLSLSTIRLLVKELDEEFEIKFVEERENNREKKKIYIRTIDDFIYNYFNFETIDHPMTRRLIKSARSQKIDIIFRMPDGSEQILKPDITIDEFKLRRSKSSQIESKYNFTDKSEKYFDKDADWKQRIISYVQKIFELTNIINIEIDTFYDPDFGNTALIVIPPNINKNKIDYEDEIAEIIIEHFPEEDFSKLTVDVRRS